MGEDDKPKIDKERSLGYVKRAKRRQYAGDEQAFSTLVRIKQCKARTLLNEICIWIAKNAILHALPA
eukprot:8663311-Pyramimonas_sp.AAC.1